MSLNVNRCAVVLDVREQWEWDQGHVSCATRLQVQKRLEGSKLNFGSCVRVVALLSIPKIEAARSNLEL